MAENEIKIKVRDDGATATAKQIDQLTASLERQRKTQEMIRQTSAQIKRQNTIDEIKREASAVNELTAALNRQGAASNTALGGVNLGVTSLRQKLGPTTALLGSFTSSMAQLTPSASGATAAMQKVTGVFNQVLALGGAGSFAGPTGIAIGGVVGLFAGLATAMGQAKQEADDLAKSTAANAAALGSYIDQVQNLRSAISSTNAKRRSESDLRTRLARGEGSPEEYENEEDTIQSLIQKRKKEFQDRVDILKNTEGTGMFVDQKTLDRRVANQIDVATRTMQRDIDELQARLDEVKSGRGEATAQASAAEGLKGMAKEQGMYMTEMGGVPADRRGGARRGLPENDTASFLMDQASTPTDVFIRQQDELNSAAVSKFNEQMDMKEAVRQSAFDAEVAATEEKALRIAGVEADLAAKQKALAEELKSAKIRISNQEAQAQMTAVQMVAGSQLKAISEVIKGKKLELGAIMEALGDQFVAAGTGLIFTGLGLSANPLMPGSGAGMVEIGAAEVAFGLTLGAVGARGKGGSNAGGAGGSGGKSGNALGFDDTSPYRNSYAPDAERGPTVINITMPTVLSATAEDGRRIEDAIKRSRYLYGSQL